MGKIYCLHNIAITYNLYARVSDKIAKHIKQQRPKDYFIKSSDYVIFIYFLYNTKLNGILKMLPLKM